MNIYGTCISLIICRKMIFDEKIRHRNGKRINSNLAIFSKGFFILILINFRISISSSISTHHFDGNDLSSFCVREKCTVVFPNGTSTSLPLTEYYHFMMEYVKHKGNVDNKDDLDLNPNFKERNNSKKSNKKDENTNDKIIQTSTAPADQTKATEPTSYDENETESATNISLLKENSGPDPSFHDECQGLSKSVSDSSCYCRVRLEDGTIQLKYTSNRDQCVWIEEKDEENNTKSSLKIDPEGGAIPIDESGKESAISHAGIIAPEMDYDYGSKEEEFQFQVKEPIIYWTEYEVEKAKEMTKCAEKVVENGITCMCNSTYCDKFVPPERTTEWTYTLYTTSKEGHRFQKQTNKLMPYKEDEEVFYEGVFYVNTSRKYQKILGFGGAFTDSSCKLIKDLSKTTRKNLLESYFGPFGINYNLVRVPIAGSDFSPSFYTYMDFEDNSTSNFMLTEQDFKYKIPIILQAMNLSGNQLKLLGCAWSAPIWMKTEPKQFFGTLKREFWSLWAEYHIKFLDQYETSGVKFWAISAGNEPMNYYYITEETGINALEWSPYEQSQWVGYYLCPMLKNSSHKDVLILGMDENREFVEFYMKYFYQDYQLKYFDDPNYVGTNAVVDCVDGIQLHGYMDSKQNSPYLEKTREMYPDDFLIYSEFSCLGKPELGSWTCAESYATQIIVALNHWVTGWIDWNIALDSKGGPSYLNVALHSPIIVDVERDEFQKEPIFYIMGHFSIFLLPDSYRIEIEAPKGFENIYAVAVHRPDDGKVIVIYNQYENDKQVTFIIDKKYKLSIEVPANSINSVLFW